MNFPSGFKDASRWLRGLAAVAGLALLYAGGLAKAASAGPALSSIVLVHGAFADGSSWSPVITKLQALGYRVTAVQIPLTSLAADVAATEQVLRRQSGAVLLVGHSWGGVVITQAGNAANVKGLVFLSALAPDSGESAAAMLATMGAPMEGLTPDADGMIWLDDPRQFHRAMASDMPMKKVRGMAAVQQPIAAASFTEAVQHAAWRDKPSWYLRTERDQALLPAVQQAIAQRIGARTVSIRSSHMSLLSHPEAVASLIDRAAQGGR